MAEKTIPMTGWDEKVRRLGSLGIFLPVPTVWERLETPENLKKWGWESEKILDKEIFGNPKLNQKGEPVYEPILSEFDNGTSFLEFGKYLFGVPAEWLGAQIGENCFDTDIIAATAKRAGAERIVNTPDRLLGIYILSTMLGGWDEAEKPSEGYVGEGVRGEGKPPEVPPEKELLPEEEKIKKYTPEKIEKLKRGIDNLEANLKELKKYLSEHPKLMRKYETLLRKIMEEFTDYKRRFDGYEEIMDIVGGIYFGDRALREYKTKNKAKGEIEKLYLPKGMDYCARVYIETKDPMEVIQAYNIIYKIGKKKYDSEGRHYGG